MAIPAQHCDPPDARHSTIYDCLDESDDESDARYLQLDNARLKADNAKLMALAERALYHEQSTSDRCHELAQENQKLKQDNAKLAQENQKLKQQLLVDHGQRRSTKATNRCKRRSTKASKEPKPMGCYVVKAYALC